MASLAGLLCSIRSLFAGNAGRLVGMLSGLLGRAVLESGATGGLTIEAESAGLADWACAVVAASVAAARVRPSEIPKARDFMCISRAARGLIELAKRCRLLL
ncbi:hypothetical protein ASG35_23170 [Burkholderia sp. Leaf177]|nr:hypothetical protein ASG35_23170 [Burkholderia sp. Leaf177]